MRRREAVAWVALFSLIAAGPIHAGTEGRAGGPGGSAELERVKTLAGRWEGTSKMGDGSEESVQAEYRVTSGGSAVVETLSPGTPHEMVSVYHDEHGKVAMTHYCMLGNHPELTLTKTSDKELDFSLTEDSDIDSAKEQHMHALTLTQSDADHLSQVWTCYEGGKPAKTVVISLSHVH